MTDACDARAESIMRHAARILLESERQTGTRPTLLLMHPDDWRECSLTIGTHSKTTESADGSVSIFGARLCTSDMALRGFPIPIARAPESSEMGRL